MNQTLRQKNQLLHAAERGLRREQPIRCGRIVLVFALLLIVWGVLA